MMVYFKLILLLLVYYIYVLHGFINLAIRLDKVILGKRLVERLL